MSVRTIGSGLLALILSLSAVAAQADDLVPFGTSWSYLAPISIDEDPNITDGDFDDTWFLPSYDTTTPIPWDVPSPEPLGYGTIDGFPNGFATVLDTPASGDRYTAYFRHSFTTTSPASALAFELLIDDGAKIYLDGEEILSFNCCANAMPGEIAAHSEFASAVGTENMYSIQEVLQGETVPAGEHLLAVAVHNQAADSSDLGFSLRLISDYVPPEPDPNAITTGIDTTLAQSGLNGPDLPHGDLAEWEWDGDDAGGQNHGLLWFDIPQERLDNFGNSTATLQLRVTNEGSSGDVHRMTVDWLTGDFGGDEMTWLEMPPGGDGLFPGDNMEEDPSFSTGDVAAGAVVEFDVTADVLAWASGVPNYGWGFYPPSIDGVPTGTNGVGIASFESGQGPVLILTPETVGIPGDYDGDGSLDAGDLDLQAQAMVGGLHPKEYDLTGDDLVNYADRQMWVDELKNTWIGDANLNGEFNSGDMVQVFVRGKYETRQPAGWEDGDWNGDTVFGSGDMVAAFVGGGYEKGLKPGGPNPAVSAVPEPSAVVLAFVGLLSLVAGVRKEN